MILSTTQTCSRGKHHRYKSTGTVTTLTSGVRLEWFRCPTCGRFIRSEVEDGS